MSKKQQIYMNDHIKDPRTKEPVIAVQNGRKLVYGNRVDLVYNGVVVASVIHGRLDAPVHDVKVYIETDCGLVVN